MLLDTPVIFQGFGPELLDFFDRLAAHNERTWFQAHRAQYEACCLEPARQMRVALLDPPVSALRLGVPPGPGQ